MDGGTHAQAGHAQAGHAQAGHAQDGPSRATASLRAERDRFVAFAFCAADVLVEVDGDMTIVYAAGASAALLGGSSEEVTGTKFTALVDAHDIPMVDEFVWSLRQGRRVAPVAIKLRGRTSQGMHCSLAGYHLPEVASAFFFAIRISSAPAFAGGGAARGDARGDTRSDARGDARGDAGGGLLEKDNFAQRVSERLQRAREGGEDLKLTLLQMQKMDELWARLDDDAAEALSRTIGACLRMGAGPEEIAGRFDDQNYGFLHSSDADIDAIQSRIESHLKSADPEGQGVEVLAGTVTGALLESDDASAVKALVHTINEFCQSSAQQLTTVNASATVERLAKESSHRLSTLRSIVSSQDFYAAFHPVVNVLDMRIHHYEALARFGGECEISPQELIQFAENAGLIGEFDLAMCRKTMVTLRELKAEGEPFRVSVNFSGDSLGSPGFRGNLRDLLKEFSDVRAQVLIEITDSYRIPDLSLVNSFFLEMRGAGLKVCLDDFGAESGALSHLTALDVDLVKIDGKYIAGAHKSDKQRTLLRHIAQMCKDLGIETIAKRVQHGNTLAMLRSCGIGYAQGFLFGRPHADIRSFGVKRLGDPSRHIVITQ